MRRFIALDVGEKRTGVALVDDENRVATPLLTIEAKPDSQEFQDTLKDIVSEWEPVRIIFGLPIDLKGKESIAAKKMRLLADLIMQEVNKRYSENDEDKIGFEFVDERLTSAQAEKSLLKADFGAKSRKGHRDALAAALIAQSWADSL